MSSSVTINSASYSISGDGFAKTGPIPMSGGAVVSAVIGGIPIGSRYTLSLTAGSSDGSVSCVGSAPFAVSESGTTLVPVVLACGSSLPEGSVSVRGTANVCPAIENIIFEAARVPVGSSIAIASSVSDADNGPSSLQYAWTVTQGSVSNPTDSATEYSCTSAGAVTVTLTVTDGGCSESFAAPISCICATGADCPGSDTECSQRTCVAGACGVANIATGTAIQSQFAGNCHKNVCDGAGGVVSLVDDTNLPVDGKFCTQDLCINGAPSNPGKSAGTACTDGGGGVCDGHGVCQPTTFRLVRVGDGSEPLSTASAPVFLEERTTDGSLLSTLALPKQPEGANAALSLAGNDEDAGGLSVSADGRYSILAGYAVAPGTVADVRNASASAAPRVLARVSRDGTVDTSTLVATGSSGGALRQAVSSDGASFWAVGADGDSGLWFTSLGTSGGTRMLDAEYDAAAIAAGQLYVAPATTSGASLLQVGAALPKTPNQATTALAGVTVAAAHPSAFALFDVSSAVAGVDTMYIADPRAPELGGGLQKWVSDGSTWLLSKTFNLSPTPVGFYGVGGVAIGTTVIVAATTAESSSQRLAILMDDGTANSALQAISTALPNTVYRGVALSPHD